MVKGEKLEKKSMKKEVEVLDIKDDKSNRKRNYRCCVPHCTTYGPSYDFLALPSADSHLRRVWIDAIPRKNWLVCHNTMICKSHFKRPRTWAQPPTLFPKPAEPSNLEDKYRKIDRGMFQASSRYTLPETFGELAQIPDYDKFIFDFPCFISKYREQLKNVLEVCKWLTTEGGDKLVFYRLGEENGCVKILISVTMDAQMKPTVALEGVVMDPLDLTRHVPINGKITHWDQMNLMLLDLGYER